MGNRQRKECGLLGLFILGFALVYLSLCFNDNIWTDEAFTIDLLRSCNTYGEAVWFTAGDVHPPLYYLILKPFTDAFGIHLFLLKALSIVPMLFTMGLGITFVHRRFGFKTAFLYILMLGLFCAGRDRGGLYPLFCLCFRFVDLRFFVFGSGFYQTEEASGIRAGCIDIPSCLCAMDEGLKDTDRRGFPKLLDSGH